MRSALHELPPPNVGLFVTCLVDLVRPQVGFAAVKLLEQAGCDVEVPVQTCCGQPAWNSGADRHAADMARQVMDAFERFDYVVAPSGSCAGMIKRHYPEVLANDPVYAAARARAGGEDPRADLVPGERARHESRRSAMRARRLLSRFLLLPARDERARRAASSACSMSKALQLDGTEGAGGLLRLRRTVLRQVPGNLRAHGRRQDRRCAMRPARS